jgi:hypothetical protein
MEVSAEVAIAFDYDGYRDNTDQERRQKCEGN